ncbi:hypothetical protein N5I62_14620 [Klebsiella quasipneumoniae]|uniref:hypothetical protein n=1 Tax=Klebsiella quasipneumoniae TaxID=1463165 RepID=UPI002247194A|nr:hypothetical protein [Klebsiella quasipneumoniae]MCW9410966.1 hypothetical protein [Klebsiella quasipneumoniae]
MVAKLGFVVDGSSWAPGNIIGSLYPQPTAARIGILSSDGVTMLVGDAPTKIGSPGLSPGYQTLNAINAGYDTGVPDNITKTVMILAKPVLYGSKRALGIGSYHGGSGTPPVPQGDTLVISPIDNSVRAIASTTTGTASQSTIAGSSLDISKFHLYMADYSESALQVSAFHNNAFIAGNVAAAANRAIPSSNIRIGIGYDVVDANGFDAPIQVAAWGAWTGVNLTTAEKASMYSTLKNMLGGIIPIS